MGQIIIPRQLELLLVCVSLEIDSKFIFRKEKKFRPTQNEKKIILYSKKCQATVFVLFCQLCHFLFSG